MKFLLLLRALSASRLQCFSELLDLAVFRLEKLIGLRDQRVGLVKLRLLLAPFRLSGGDVALVARD